MIFNTPKAQVDSVSILDAIMREVHKITKPMGFRKYGRTLHRFVSEDISQVINFQLGRAHLGETHLLTVNIAIGVPECTAYLAVKEATIPKYRKEYECNIRSTLGETEGKKVSVYDLRKNTEPIIQDILRQLQNTVLPAFEVLNSRESILAHRRDYPHLDRLNDHLILREEAMIHRHLGDPETAQTKYSAYIHNMIHDTPRRGVNLGTRQCWIQAALKIAKESDISISPEILDEAQHFLSLS